MLVNSRAVIADAVEHPELVPLTPSGSSPHAIVATGLCAIWRVTDRSGNKLQQSARRRVAIAPSLAIELQRASAVSYGNLSKSVRSI